MKEACGCANIGTEGEVGGQNVGVYGDEGTGVLVGADKEGKKQTRTSGTNGMQTVMKEAM